MYGQPYECRHIPPRNAPSQLAGQFGCALVVPGMFVGAFPNFFVGFGVVLVVSGTIIIEGELRIFPGFLRKDLLDKVRYLPIHPIHTRPHASQRTASLRIKASRLIRWLAELLTAWHWSVRERRQERERRESYDGPRHP